MLVNKLKRNSKIEYHKDSKLLKYSMIIDNQIVKFNRGRALEGHARYNYNGIVNIDLENIPHTQAGDIKIDGIDYNVKSYKCELKAEGLTIEEKIENYIASDASEGMIYIVEHNEEIIEIRMNWEETKNFLKTFGRLDRGNIRITTCDNKIYNWATQA